MQSRKRCPWGLAISLMSLAGCATGVSEPGCIPLRSYTPAEQAAMADELDRLGPASMTGRFLADYATLRDGLRAACIQEGSR